MERNNRHDTCFSAGVDNYAVLFLDKDGNIQGSNSYAEKLNGYDTGEIIGNNIRIFYTEEDRERQLPEQLLEIARKKGNVHCEGWRVRKDGTLFLGDVSINALRDDKQNISGYTKIVRDITGYNRELEKNVINTLVDNTPDLMWSVDRDYRLISSNKTFDKMILVMKGRQVTKGMDVLSLGYTEEENTRWKLFYDRAFSGEAFSEIENINANFEYWSKTYFYPIREQGDVMGVACCAHDITDIKQAKQRIEYTNRLYAFLSEMNKAIVRATDSRTLYKEACRIAVECGRFAMAWISAIDVASGMIDLMEEYGMPPEDVERFSNKKFVIGGPQHHVLETSGNFICNDLENFHLDEWKQWGKSRGIRSFMILPIKRSGVVIGSFNLYASEVSFFTEEEIKLLESATEDVSFAIAIYEKEKIRKRAEQMLMHSGQRLKQAQQIAHIGSWERNFASNVAIWSDEHCRIFGLSPDDNLQTFESWLSFIHSDDQEYIKKVFAEARANRKSVTFNYRIVRRDGSLRHIYSECHFDLDNEGRAIGSYGIAHDITDRVLTEEKLRHANRLYAFTSEISQCMLRCSDEHTFLNEICNVASGIGKFELAWVGLPDIKNKVIAVFAHNNADPSDIASFHNLPYMKDGPTANALQTGRHYVLNNFTDELIPAGVRAFASRRKVRSGICMPVKKGGKIHYTFNLFSSQTDFFNDEEIMLVEKAAADISFALDVIEKEKQRTQAEAKLKHNEKRLRQAQAIAHIGSWEMNWSSGKSTWSEEHCRIFGVPADDNVHALESYLSFIHPDDVEHVKEQCVNGINLLKSFSYYHRIIRRNDGAVRYIFCDNHFELDKQGNPISLYGVSHDITESKEAEQKLLSANRLYSFTSHINKAIVHNHDEHLLLSTICRVAVEVGKLDFAWAGAVDDAHEQIHLFAEHGGTSLDLEMFRNLSYSESLINAYAIRHNTHYVLNDINRNQLPEKLKAYSGERGFRSAIALPLRKNGKIVSVINLYSREVDFFTDGEIALLCDAADDISFALDVFENERLKKETEDKLKHSELRLKQAQQVAHLGNWEVNFITGEITWSDEHCRIFGLDVNSNVQSFATWVSFIHPDDRDYVMQLKAETSKNKTHAFTYRIITKDGIIKHIYSEAYYEYNAEGQPVGLYGIAHDITKIKEAEEKLINANRLYSFTSHINQTIVHVSDEQALFDKACQVAVDVGKFELAWIAAVDEENKKMRLVAEKGAIDTDKEIFGETEYDEHGFTGNVLRKNSYHIINDLTEETFPAKWKAYAAVRNFKSGIALPIRKSGRICFTLNLSSSRKGFFSEQEIALLEEAAMDISFALDVIETEKVKKETLEKLRYSERRLKQAQEVAHFGNWELDFAKGVATWSEEALRIYGIPVDQCHQTYEDWLSYIHPNDLDYVLNIIGKAQETMSNTAFFFRIVRKDGTVRHLFSQTNYEFDSEGRPIGLYGVAHDVTEMKEVEKALELSKSNLRLIVDLLPQAVFAKDNKGRFVFVNKTFANLYGLAPKQMINRAIAEIVPGKNDPQYFLNQDREVMDSGAVKVIPELKFTDYMGREGIYYATKVPYKIPGKNVTAVLGIALDITEQKKAEAEKAKIVADIVQRNKDLEQFSYIVSHNLRAPVANIIGITSLLQISNHDYDDTDIMMQGLYSSVNKLDTVIKDLNYILSVKNNISEKREWINFTKLVEDIKASIGSIIVKESARIIADFSDADTIFSAKSYVYSIFFNLITNSIKYRRPDVTPVIEITGREKDGTIELVFKDNGLGIDLSAKGQYVFGLYKRFHDHTEGKGMGLYMVKTQVEAIGGKISVESEVNKGTTFRIIINTDTKQKQNDSSQ